MRQGGKHYSDMLHSLFLNSTCDMGIDNRQRHAILAFLKIKINSYLAIQVIRSIKIKENVIFDCNLMISIMPRCKVSFSFINHLNESIMSEGSLRIDYCDERSVY